MPKRKAIVQAQRKFAFHFIVDGHVVTEEPHATYAAGRQAKVPMLIGWNANEGASFMAGQTITAANFRETLQASFGALPEPLLANYPAQTDAQARAARAAIERDLRFGYESWKWTRLQAATPGTRVYAYRFQHEPAYPADSPFAGWGAAHGMEMPYVFDQLRQSRWPWKRADHRLADMLVRYWTNFAKHGDPNLPGQPRWPAYTSTEAVVMRLGPELLAGSEADTGGLRALDSLFEGVRNHRTQPRVAPR